jgi:hypothetical protein
MSIIVPNAIEGEILNSLLNTPLHLRLYSNNVTPLHASTVATFTEVAGGGYGALPLTFANWTITAVDPSTAVYNAVQNFNFTGPTSAPGTIYGYFITRDSDGHLMWAERFFFGNVPFIPIVGSKISISPKFACISQF